MLVILILIGLLNSGADVKSVWIRTYKVWGLQQYATQLRPNIEFLSLSESKAHPAKSMKTTGALRAKPLVEHDETPGCAADRVDETAEKKLC